MPGGRIWRLKSGGGDHIRRLFGDVARQHGQSPLARIDEGCEGRAGGAQRLQSIAGAGDIGRCRGARPLPGGRIIDKATGRSLAAIVRPRVPGTWRCNDC